MMHSCALPYGCILNVMHLRALQCIQMSCILMHSDHDAFIRIILHKFVFQFTTAELPDFDATRARDAQAAQEGEGRQAPHQEAAGG